MFSLKLSVCLYSESKNTFERLSLQTSALVFCSALPAKSNGFIRVDCFGGLNQMRRDVSVLDQCFLLSPHKAIIDHVTLLQLCDGVGITRLLNATLVLPKFEVAAYWNESR